MPSPSDIKAGLAAAASKAASGTSRAQAGAPPPGGPQGVFDFNGLPVTAVNAGLGMSTEFDGGTVEIAPDDLILDLEFTTPGTTLPTGSRGEVLHFARSGTAQFFLDGVLTTAADGAPRITHEGLIIEPATTNLIPAPANNSLLTASGWVDNAATASAGATDPDGGTYTRISEVAANGAQRRYYLTSGAGSAKTLSAHVSKVTGGTARYFVLADNAGPAHYVVFDIVTGLITASVGTGTIGYAEDLGPEWRFSMSSDSMLSAALIALGHSSNGTTISYAGNTSNWIDVRKVQLENTAYPTGWCNTTRGVESCWLVTSRPIGSEYSVEVEYTPIGSNNRGATAEPILSIGQHGAAQSMQVFLTSGTAEFMVYDGSAAEKHIVSAALSTSTGGIYYGMRKVVACSDGIARPAMLIDGREQTTTPAGAGTGVFTAMTPTQSKVRLGCTSAGTAGGVIIKRVRIRSLRKPYSKAICGSSYSRHKWRGYCPDARVFAAIGDSITDAVQVDTSIPESWVSIAARAKGTNYIGHNYGVGSQGLEDIVRRYYEHVRPLIVSAGYRTLVFQGGINSANADQTAAEMWAVTLPVLTDALSAGITKLICWSLMPGGDHTSSTRYAAKTGYNALLSAWCAANGATYYDAWTSFFSGTTNPIIDPTYNQGGDGLHLNAAGNTKAGTEIAALL